MPISLATFFVGLVSGLVPFVNAEAYLVSVSAFAPAATLGAVVVAATLGQMTAKCLLFLTGRGLVHLPIRRREASGLARVKGFLEGGAGRAAALVFVSALCGIPPFYLVTLAAGALGFPLGRFCALGTLGRVLRFAAVFYVTRAL
jgi:membrane protein YqaA with SNARE-associated domain